MPETKRQGWTAKGKRVYDEAGRLVARATSKEAAQLMIKDHRQARRFRLAAFTWRTIEGMSAELAGALGGGIAPEK